MQFSLQEESRGLRIGFVVGVVAVEGRLLIFPNLNKKGFVKMFEFFFISITHLEVFSFIVTASTVF